MPISARQGPHGVSMTINRMARIGVLAEAFRPRSLTPFGPCFVDDTGRRVVPVVAAPGERGATRGR